MSREQLLNSPDYWTQKIQLELYNAIYSAIEEKGSVAFAEKAGVSKRLMSDVTAGEFNGSLSELVQIALAAGKVPVVTFVDVDEYLL